MLPVSKVTKNSLFCIYFIENFSQFLQWLVFIFFICLQLNLLHNSAATKHFGFTRKQKEKEGKEKCTGKLIKNNLKIRRIY